MPFAKCRLGDGLADAFGAAQNGAASVSQTSVSLAAGMLQKAGIIHYQHGRITIVDRVGLEGAACACYKAVVSEYRDMMGGDPAVVAASRLEGPLN